MTAAFAAGQIVGPLLAAWTARLGASLPQNAGGGRGAAGAVGLGLGKITAAQQLGIMQSTQGQCP